MVADCVRQPGNLHRRHDHDLDGVFRGDVQRIGVAVVVPAIKHDEWVTLQLHMLSNVTHGTPSNF
jgi:hypothetical protein